MKKIFHINYMFYNQSFLNGHKNKHNCLYNKVDFYNLFDIYKYFLPIFLPSSNANSKLLTNILYNFGKKKIKQMSIPYLPKIKKQWIIYILLLIFIILIYKIYNMISLIIDLEQKILNCEIQFNCKYYSGNPFCIKN